MLKRNIIHSRFLKKMLNLILIYGLLSVIFLANLWLAFYFFSPRYRIEKAFPDLEFQYPVGIYNAGDDSDRLFILEQEGIIYVIENDQDTDDKSIFLDIHHKVSFGGEMGLLGLAFHPNFEDNGLFYIDYTRTDPRETIISKFQMDPLNPNKADLYSEEILLNISQPYTNHNGGQITFGPDGYLYIAMGDGGSAGDPQENAQNRRTFLGSILRIDVNTDSLYEIPADNPYASNTKGYLEEIYAYGLRNPWRFSFDPETQFLWAADVGQNDYEEIDIIEIGKNYGWNIKEGFDCYESDTCDDDNLEDPIFVYDHNVGHSITGGFVYRGSDFPSLIGKYIYADYEFGQIWALEYDGRNKTTNTLLIDTDLEITSFGLDEHNELYICAFDGYIYKLEVYYFFFRIFPFGYKLFF